MFKKSCSVGIMFGIMLFMTALTSSAVETGGVSVPDTLDTGKDQLVLNGTGIRTKFSLKVYVGALYLKIKNTAGSSQSIIEADEPMAITMAWKRNVSRKKITDVFAKGFRYGAGDGYDALKNEIETFLAALVEARKQDVWKYVYTPDTGVGIYYNDKIVTFIKGIDFKKALFSVWLMEGDAFKGDIGLRDGMLGK